MTISISKNLEIFELKQLADLEDAYKSQCRKALEDYKFWGNARKSETDQIELLYGNLRGDVLRRTAEESVRAYWRVRTDFRKWFHRYLAQTKHYPSNNN